MLATSSCAVFKVKGIMGNCPYRQCVGQRKKKNFLSLSAVRVTPPATLWASFCQTFLSRLSLSFHFPSRPSDCCWRVQAQFFYSPCHPMPSAREREHTRPSITSANNGSDACGKSRKHGGEGGAGRGATSLARPRAHISIHT